MAKQTFTTGQVLTAAQMTSLQQTAMGGGSTTAKVASYVLVAADAGTVVQMNAAGATTITVNTALFAAGDTVQIQNVGAGVCTVTAGTATVSTAGSLALSQYEGGQLYFTSTSASIFFDIVQSSGMTNPLTTTGDTIYSSSGSTPARLGIGSTGQVLTVASGIPSWATPAASTPSFVGCVLNNTITQSIANNTYQAATFNNEVVDTDSFHDNSTNTNRITIPAGKAGKYLLTVTATFATNGTGARVMYMTKNSTTPSGATTIGSVQGLANGSQNTSIAYSVIVNLSVADWVNLSPYQSSGGALDLFGNNSDGNILSFTATYLGA